MIHPVRTLAFLTCFALVCGCGASSPTPKGPMSHIAARGAVDLAKVAWGTVAAACVEVGVQNGDTELVTLCKDVMMPGRDAIMEADRMANTLGSNNEQAFVCALETGLSSIKVAEVALKKYGSQVDQVVADAYEVESLLGVKCLVDAGPEAGK